MEHTRGNDLKGHPTAWKTLTKFVLNDPDKTMVPGTRVPERQIHTLPIWYYEGIYFALTDVLTATNRPVPVGKQDFHKRHEKGTWEFYMAPSRDAITLISPLPPTRERPSSRAAQTAASTRTAPVHQ